MNIFKKIFNSRYTYTILDKNTKNLRWICNFSDEQSCTFEISYKVEPDIGFFVSIKNDMEDTVCVSLYFFIKVFLSMDSNLYSKPWFEKMLVLHKFPDYHLYPNLPRGRKVGFMFSFWDELVMQPIFIWDLGNPIYEWWNTLPKWIGGYVPVFDKLFGGFETYEFCIDKKQIDIIMPEDIRNGYPEETYTVYVEINKLYSKRPKSLLCAKSTRAEVSSDTGIPHPGKGTAAYNCGQDRLYSATYPKFKGTIEDAAELFKQDAIDMRKKYPL